MPTDQDDLPDLDNVDPDLLLPEEVIDAMTEDELAVYMEGLKASAAEWRLTPVQQRAEDTAKHVDQILYGGAAGGGKTEWMLYHVYQQCLAYPGLRALGVRRTFPQLRKSLIERSLQRYLTQRPIRAKYMPSEKRWKFDNGSEFEFGFCDAEDDYRHYLSAEYDLICVERSTPIAMADGSWKPICEVEAGDLVETLEGPRKVQRAWRVGTRPVARVTTPFGSVLCSQNHAVLSADREWVSPAELWSRSSSTSAATSSTSGPCSRAPGKRQPATSPDRRPLSQGLKRALDRAVGLDRASSSADTRNGYGASGGSPQGDRLPLEWSGLLALHGPVARRSSPDSVPPSQQRAQDHAHDGSSARGCSGGCSSCRGLRDGRSRATPGDVQARIPSPADAAGSDRCDLPSDDPETTPSDIRRHPRWYPHPYTSENRVARVDLLHAEASMVPAGEAEVWDLQVCGSRHYVTYSGMIAKNCFEELTEFTEMQFKMIASRCRTTTKKLKQGVTPRVIAATNPGQIGHDFVLKYFVRPTDYGEKIALREVEVGNRVHQRTVAFVPAKVTDNPHIDPNYVFNLGDLSEHKRRQYLDGDWDAFEGQFFGEFSKEEHVIEPFLIPKNWPRVRGIDYGMAKPFGCLWFAFDQDGNAYAYRELYRTGMTATEQARAIITASKHPDSKETYGRDAGRPEVFDRTVADPSVFTKTGSGMSIAQMYAKEGLVVQKAMNARVDGWNRLRDYLRGVNGAKLYIFKTCPNFIDEMTSAVFDDVNVEDLDTMGADHLLDCARYGLAARNRSAKKSKQEKDPMRLSSRLDAILKERRRPAVELGA